MSIWVYIHNENLEFFDTGSMLTCIGCSWLVCSVYHLGLHTIQEPSYLALIILAFSMVLGWDYQIIAQGIQRHSHHMIPTKYRYLVNAQFMGGGLLIGYLNGVLGSL